MQIPLFFCKFQYCPLLKTLPKTHSGTSRRATVKVRGFVYQWNFYETTIAWRIIIVTHNHSRLTPWWLFNDQRKTQCHMNHITQYTYCITAIKQIILERSRKIGKPANTFLNGGFAWWRHHIWKHFPRYWPFVRGIHRSPVDSHHKGQWHGALMFSLIYAATPKQTVEQTNDMLMIWDAIAPIMTSL